MLHVAKSQLTRISGCRPSGVYARWMAKCQLDLIRRERAFLDWVAFGYWVRCALSRGRP